MKALKVVELGKAEVQEVDIPAQRDEYLLVKVSHAGLNPTDWKHIDFLGYSGATVGCDYMGYVEKIGSKCSGNWKKGDRVAGIVQGCNAFELEDGCIAEYAMVKEGGCFKVPDNVSDAEAATLGVALATVGLTLYLTLGLPWPGSVPADCYLLIYGGSSATGTIAIQFAKLSGAKVITTCSPRNFGLVKSLGAEEAFEYNDPHCVKKIRDYTKDKLYFSLDCFGGDTGVKVSAESISSQGGHLCTIIPFDIDKYPRDDVRKSLVLAYRIRGEKWTLAGQEHPPTVEDYEFGKIFMKLAVKLLAEGALKTHPPRVGNGFEGVLAGFDEMRQGKVSGEKLVYKL